MPRIKESHDACYHIVSRIVDRRMLLDSKEKERLRQVIHAVAGFAGTPVLTFALLDNHFHILLHVPQRRDVSDEEWLERLGFLYTPSEVARLAEALQQCRTAGQTEQAEALKAEYTYRMYDLSEFMKTLKQRFTQSYNHRHGRKGTLWEERFKSLLLQGRGGRALATVAAYIDLNAVRAGIVNDPKDYRFCGYGEAVAGNTAARAGLCEVLSTFGVSLAWEQAAGQYRQFLYQAGQVHQGPDGVPSRRPGFDAKAVATVLEAGGELPLPELLRCRIRYFSDGVILGSQVYVEDVFERYRSRFSALRKTGARPTRGGLPELFTVRRLRTQVITVPASG